jgi:NAD(P)-dependent dehydrogenase (short-subunit alcohol dehydrogenase family)
MAAGLAIVTGAASGMCRAAAVELAARGHALALLDVNAQALDEVHAEIEAGGGRAGAYVADVGDPVAVSEAVDRAVAELGTPDVVVNGAGIIIRKPLLDTTPEDWHRVLSVNLTGCFNVLRAAVPHMTSGGSIIQIASSAAHIGGHGYPAYTASKGGVLAMTKQLAAELAPRNIRINSISPGPIATGINDGIFSDPANREMVTRAVPLSRIGQPRDIAAAIAFLTSADAGFITGIDIVVDGGFISAIKVTPATDGYVWAGVQE